jgi:hypothetical protein
VVRQCYYALVPPSPKKEHDLATGFSGFFFPAWSSELRLHTNITRKLTTSHLKSEIPEIASNQHQHTPPTLFSTTTQLLHKPLRLSVQPRTFRGIPTEVSHGNTWLRIDELSQRAKRMTQFVLPQYSPFPSGRSLGKIVEAPNRRVTEYTLWRGKESCYNRGTAKECTSKYLTQIRVGGTVLRRRMQVKWETKQINRLLMKTNKMHKWHVSVQFVAPCLTIIRVRCHRVINTMICAFVQGVIVYKYILHNPNIVWYVDN